MCNGYYQTYTILILYFINRTVAAFPSLKSKAKIPNCQWCPHIQEVLIYIFLHVLMFW